MQAATELWKSIDRLIWSRTPQPRLPLPTHPFTVTTGDASALHFPEQHFWHYLHTFVISRIYIQRCNLAFARNPTPSYHTIIAEIVGAVKTDISDCISAAEPHGKGCKPPHPRKGLPNSAKFG